MRIELIVTCCALLAACSDAHRIAERGSDEAPHHKPRRDAGSSDAGPHDGGAHASARPLHLVVIYLENHSFDNLYGGYPGVEGLDSPAARVPQIDLATGEPYATLPQVDPHFPSTLPNEPFDISAYVPQDEKILDLVHAFYQEQQQIHAGRMDAFVAVSDAKGLALGYYPTDGLPLARRLLELGDQVTICDHFFHAAFGGSFLNHIWLIAARSPVFPDAPSSLLATFDERGALVADGSVSPEGFAVNNLPPANLPHPADANPAELVPSQTFATIGDRLSDAGVDWAWYSGGWDDALAGHPDPDFQFHHQPFAYFERYAEGTAERASHLLDERALFAAAARGELPAVSFVKPIGPEDEHPGYADLARGEEHAVELLDALIASPSWPDTVVIVTYDENGGFWDHVPPPEVDAWGPGTRVPAMVISPLAKGGVDSTVYDTTAILSLIERWWQLPPLGDRDASQPDLARGALRLD